MLGVPHAPIKQQEKQIKSGTTIHFKPVLKFLQKLFISLKHFQTDFVSFLF